MPREPEKLPSISPSDDYEQLLKYALSLLARKRYTKYEMLRKLEQFVKRKMKEQSSDYIQGLKKSVMRRLEELRYLDDRQYAQDYIAERTRLRPRGIYLLKKELERRKIQRDIIEEAIKSSALNEEVVALKILNKKIKFWKDLESNKRKQKSFAFLASKGFGPDAIYKAVKRCYDLDVDENL